MQWLQQCHSQGVTPTCPMCQAPLQLHVQWHLFGTRRRHLANNRQQAAGRAAQMVNGDAEAANNYLLEHQPRLADMLADMPNILAQENVQLLAEVQVNTDKASLGLYCNPFLNHAVQCLLQMLFVPHDEETQAGAS